VAWIEPRTKVPRRLMYSTSDDDLAAGPGSAGE
jgi:hypothetical protein